MSVGLFVWRLGTRAERLNSQRPLGRRLVPTAAFGANALRPDPVEESDLTEINLFFANEPIQREVELAMMTPNVPEPFYIQPNGVKAFHGVMNFRRTSAFPGVTPHCHLLGQREVFAVSPDENDIPPVSIPEWVQLAGHIRLSVVAACARRLQNARHLHDENTSDNPYNPNDPPQDDWGGHWRHEMYVLFSSLSNTWKMKNTLSTADEDARIVYQSDVLFPAGPIPPRQGRR